MSNLTDIVKNFFEGMFYYGMYKLDLLPDNFIQDFDRKLNICNGCPLKVGNVCSRKKAMRLSMNDRFDRLPKYLDKIPKGVKLTQDTFEYMLALWKKGCSCYLPFKIASSSKCPIYKW